MNSTVCEHLASAALMAYFELSEYRLMRKDEDLPLVKKFLRDIVTARIQFPERMKKIEKLFDKTAMFSLGSSENALSDLLSPVYVNASQAATLLRHCDLLYKISEALNAVHREVFKKAEQAYNKAIAI
jgi:hypothetical protein